MRPLMPPVQTPDNLFHDGNPLTGELGTIVDAEHLNNVQGAVRDAQSELITVLNAAGINVDPSKQNQLLTALKALLLSRSNPFGDIKSDGTVKTALENLGLKEAAKRGVGTGENQIPDMNSFPANISSTGSGTSLGFANGLIIKHGNTTSGNGPDNAVKFPVAFPSSCIAILGVYNASIASFFFTFNSITRTGFSFRGFSGGTPNTPAGANVTCTWLALGY